MIRQAGPCARGNWGFSYPNGNSWDDVEIVCGACGQFTAMYKFTEG